MLMQSAPLSTAKCHKADDPVVRNPTNADLRPASLARHRGRYTTWPTTASGQARPHLCLRLCRSTIPTAPRLTK